jgi:hypothetical protein
VVTERLGARPILTSKLVASLDSPKTPWCRWSSERSKKTLWCRWSSISRRGVDGEIPLPSLFRPRTFRSEAAAHIDNRWEGCHTVRPTGPERSPMNMQHWGPVLIAPDRGAPSRYTRCKHSYEKVLYRETVWRCMSRYHNLSHF